MQDEHNRAEYRAILIAAIALLIWPGIPMLLWWFR
jgi:hypothetical protein